MWRSIYLIIWVVSLNLFADCGQSYLRNIHPRQYLSEHHKHTMGEFRELKEQTQDGFFFYDGFSRVLISGEEVGRVLFKHYSDSETLFISHMAVKVKGKKIGTILLARALNEFPYIKRIRTNLGLDNFEVFRDAKSRGLSDIDALKRTAAYKMRKVLGFPHIIKKSIDVDMEEGSVIFEVSRFHGE